MVGLHASLNPFQLNLLIGFPSCLTFIMALTAALLRERVGILPPMLVSCSHPEGGPVGIELGECKCYQPHYHSLGLPLVASLAISAF